MSWISGARTRLQLLFRRRAAESRMNEEMTFHIDMESDRLVREEGLSRHVARSPHHRPGARRLSPYGSQPGDDGWTRRIRSPRGDDGVGLPHRARSSLDGPLPPR